MFFLRETSLVCLCDCAGVGSRMVHGTTGVPLPVECMAMYLECMYNCNKSSTNEERRITEYNFHLNQGKQCSFLQCLKLHTQNILLSNIARPPLPLPLPLWSGQHGRAAQWLTWGGSPPPPALECKTVTSSLDALDIFSLSTQHLPIITSTGWPMAGQISPPESSNVKNQPWTPFPSKPKCPLQYQLFVLASYRLNNLNEISIINFCLRSLAIIS